MFADAKVNYAFKTAKGQRDKKAPGNVCRKILWTKGLLMKVVNARWGASLTAAERAAEREVAEMQCDGEHLADSDTYMPPPPPLAPTAPPPAPKPRDLMTTDGLDFAALLASSGLTPPPPPRPAAPTPPLPPPQPAAGEDADDAQEVADAVIGPDDDDAEDVEDDSTTCTRLTCLKTVHTLLRLHLELHKPFPHHQRAAKGKIAQELGADWAVATRKHTNGTVGYYYSHLAFAHFAEPIEEHGHLQHGNDEVLEKGNCEMKRFRDMCYDGGDSSKEAQAGKTVMQTRYKLKREAGEGDEAEYEPYQVAVKRHEASWVSCMKMQVAADVMSSRRLHPVDSGRVEARKVAKRARDVARDLCKTENIAEIGAELVPARPPPAVTPPM